jgi:hypothetical protein
VDSSAFKNVARHHVLYERSKKLVAIQISNKVSWQRRVTQAHGVIVGVLGGSIAVKVQNPLYHQYSLSA